MRKPQCTIVHEDFRIKRNAEITLLSYPPEDNKRYKVKFYNLDDNRFKKGQSLTHFKELITHFKELIDRIREIRLSEKVFPEYKEKQRHLEKIESLKELERDLSEYRRSSDCI